MTAFTYHRTKDQASRCGSPESSEQDDRCADSRAWWLRDGPYRAAEKQYVNPYDEQMMKGYINRWKSSEDPDENLIDYWFCEYAKDAAYWATRELAEIDAMHFNRGITIPSSFGGTTRSSISKLRSLPRIIS
ncbi:MAG: hypothetical protein ACYCOR_12965 [Acidobacteriaceae bacterium]